MRFITDEEIEQHQFFFEACAKEYGRLGEELMISFMEEFKVFPHEGFPLKTVNPYIYRHSGKMGEWQYHFHGFHCAFSHNKTGQYIEVPLTFGEEYGELDPYFFVAFIKSTPKFNPLPIPIKNDYHDGKRILEVMLKLGRFEEINSNLKGVTGVVVKERVKKEVKIFEKGIAEVQESNQKLSFWKRWRLKIKL